MGTNMINKILACIVLAFSVSVTAPVYSASKQEIDENVKVALAEFYEKSVAGKALAEKASGMLVFPKVIKAGFGIGGEYGEGILSRYSFLSYCS